MTADQRLPASRSKRGQGNSVWKEVEVYIGHLWSLFRPGRDPGSLTVHPYAGGDLGGWTRSDMTSLIEEGRRQLDRQRAELERIQTRSQFLFTIAAALLALLVSGTSTATATHNNLAFVLWYLGIVVVMIGLLGAAALLSVRATFGSVDTVLLSCEGSPVLHELALAYVDQVPIGENTIGTRLAILRDAVLFSQEA